MEEDDPIEIPIDGILDLHTFSPRDIKTLVPDYLEECRERGILEVRLIHGKGTGALKKGVQAIISKLPEVVSFQTAEHGNWGATIVRLAPKD